MDNKGPLTLWYWTVFSVWSKRQGQGLWSLATYYWMLCHFVLPLPIYNILYLILQVTTCGEIDTTLMTPDASMRSDSDGILKHQLKVDFCDYHLPMLILKQEPRPGWRRPCDVFTEEQPVGQSRNAIGDRHTVSFNQWLAKSSRQVTKNNNLLWFLNV